MVDSGAESKAEIKRGKLIFNLAFEKLKNEQPELFVYS
jgi:hypothetical protein